MIKTEDLKGFTFFKDFGDDQIGVMAGIASREKHPGGHLLYKAGDPADKFYILEEGKVFLQMDYEAGPYKPVIPIVVDAISRGEAMGWSALVPPCIYTLGALCMEETRLITFDSAGLRELTVNDPAMGICIYKGITDMLSSRLKHTRMLLVGERAMLNMMSHTEYA